MKYLLELVNIDDNDEILFYSSSVGLDGVKEKEKGNLEMLGGDSDN